MEEEERGEDFLFLSPPLDDPRMSSHQEATRGRGKIRIRGRGHGRGRGHIVRRVHPRDRVSPIFDKGPGPSIKPVPIENKTMEKPSQINVSRRLPMSTQRGSGRGVGCAIHHDTHKNMEFTPLGPKRVNTPAWANYAANVLAVGKNNYANMAENFDAQISGMVEKHMRASGKVVPKAGPTRLEINIAQTYVNVQRAMAKAVDALHTATMLLQGAYPPQYLEARVALMRKSLSEALTYKVRIRVKQEYKVPEEDHPSGDLHTQLSTTVTQLQNFITRAQGILSKDYALVLGRYTMKNAFFRVLTDLSQLDDDPFPDLDDAFRTPEYFGERLVNLSQRIKLIEKEIPPPTNLADERKIWMDAIGTYQALERTTKRVEKQLVQMKKYFQLGRYPEKKRNKGDTNAITCSVFPSKPMAFRKKIFRFQIALVKYRSLAQNLDRFKRMADRVC